MIIVIVLAIILIALSFIKGIKIINNIKASNVLALECPLGNEYPWSRIK